MQSVHVDKYMVRTTRGTYVKTNSEEGIGYVMFNTKTAAKEWVESQGKEDWQAEDEEFERIQRGQEAKT